MNTTNPAIETQPQHHLTGTRGQRTHQRVDLEVEVDLGSDHNFFTGLTQNISEGGIFVATIHSPPVGTRLQLRLTLPGDDTPIDVTVEVRWVKEPRDWHSAEKGLGLQFVDLAPEAQARVQHFIESMREPLFYEE
jgi:uncharacterized protein (TIGR02266 family)